MPKCKNDSSRSYKGTEPSPKGLGYCGHAEKVGKRMKGKDGKIWIVVKNKNGIKKWTRFKRSSPSESAKDFKLGTKRKGGDGNKWIITKNKNGVKKWTKINPKKKTSKKKVEKDIYDTIERERKKSKNTNDLLVLDLLKDQIKSQMKNY
mgnify:CR=1 FL=1